jgi:hypothetical protein
MSLCTEFDTLFYKDLFLEWLDLRAGPFASFTESQGLLDQELEIFKKNCPTLLPRLLMCDHQQIEG